MLILLSLRTHLSIFFSISISISFTFAFCLLPCACEVDSEPMIYIPLIAFYKTGQPPPPPVSPHCAFISTYRPQIDGGGGGCKHVWTYIDNAKQFGINRFVVVLGVRKSEKYRLLWASELCANNSYILYVFCTEKLTREFHSFQLNAPEFLIVCV